MILTLDSESATPIYPDIGLAFTFTGIVSSSVMKGGFQKSVPSLNADIARSRGRRKI